MDVPVIICRYKLKDEAQPAAKPEFQHMSDFTGVLMRVLKQFPEALQAVIDEFRTIGHAYP
jgi:hypothetical protein